MSKKLCHTQEEYRRARNLSAKRWRERNKEYNRKRLKEYQDKNRIELRRYSMWNNCRDRARKRGLEFTLTREDIIIPEKCPILGISLESGFASGRESSPSVDRIDLTKGYTPDNIQVISYLANRMKNNATLEQLVLLGKWAEKIIIKESPDVPRLEHIQ